MGYKGYSAGKYFAKKFAKRISYDVYNEKKQQDNKEPIIKQDTKSLDVDEEANYEWLEVIPSVKEYLNSLTELLEMKIQAGQVIYINDEKDINELMEIDTINTLVEASEEKLSDEEGVFIKNLFDYGNDKQEVIQYCVNMYSNTYPDDTFLPQIRTSIVEIESDNFYNLLYDYYDFLLSVYKKCDESNNKTKKIESTLRLLSVLFQETYDEDDNLDENDNYGMILEEDDEDDEFPIVFDNVHVLSEDGEDTKAKFYWDYDRVEFKVKGDCTYTATYEGVRTLIVFGKEESYYIIKIANQYVKLTKKQFDELWDLYEVNLNEDFDYLGEGRGSYKITKDEFDCEEEIIKLMIAHCLNIDLKILILPQLVKQLEAYFYVKHVLSLAGKLEDNDEAKMWILNLFESDLESILECFSTEINVETGGVSFAFEDTPELPEFLEESIEMLKPIVEEEYDTFDDEFQEELIIYETLKRIARSYLVQQWQEQVDFVFDDECFEDDFNDILEKCFEIYEFKVPNEFEICKVTLFLMEKDIIEQDCKSYLTNCEFVKQEMLKLEKRKQSKDYKEKLLTQIK